jgi:AraC-like DNA-binding protein
MLSLRPVVDLPVFVARPPYDAFAPLGIDAHCATTLREPGTIIAFGAESFERDWPLLLTAVPAMRARFPSVPVILRLQTECVSDAAHLARHAALVGVRAVVSETERLDSILRRILPVPVDLASDVMAWLPLAGVRVAADCADLLREVITRAPAFRTVGEVVAPFGLSARGLRKRFHERGLQSPGHWHAVVRALEAVFRLQRDPERPLFDVALELKYSDHSALSRQMMRLFGVRPSLARHSLGWEWLLHRWIRLAATNKRDTTPWGTESSGLEQLSRASNGRYDTKRTELSIALRPGLA